MTVQKFRLIAISFVAFALLLSFCKEGLVATLVSGEVTDSFESGFTILTEMEEKEVTSRIAFRLVREEVLSGRKILYGYTPYGKKFLQDENGKINCQISVSEDRIIIGFPLIRGGY